jgi:hypothetical protein
MLNGKRIPFMSVVTHLISPDTGEEHPVIPPISLDR